MRKYSSTSVLCWDTQRVYKCLLLWWMKLSARWRVRQGTVIQEMNCQWFNPGWNQYNFSSNSFVFGENYSPKHKKSWYALFLTRILMIFTHGLSSNLCKHLCKKIILKKLIIIIAIIKGRDKHNGFSSGAPKFQSCCRSVDLLFLVPSYSSLAGDEQCCL